MAGSDNSKPNGIDNNEIDDSTNGEEVENENEGRVHEEYNQLDSKLDELNQALDFLEQKNDDIHQRLRELLQANRDIRKEIQNESMMNK